MASKNVFHTLFGRFRTNTRNSEGAAAYALSPKAALAQYAATGCFNRTFYAEAEDQLQTVLGLGADVEPAFVARTAVYARERAHQKDMPALLCALLSVRGPELLEGIFARVIDSPKMLRNFVQILRSGAVGRRSLGSRPKRLVRQWLASRSGEELFRGSVGQSPSLADVVKMVHPKPADPARAALLGYLIGREAEASLLPEIVREFESYKSDPSRPSPDVPFQMLAGLSPPASAWKEIAARATWQTTRMNLNTFHRHGVFEDAALTAKVAERLADPAEIRRARALPYQLLAAATNAGASVPAAISRALVSAAEIAVANAPRIEGKVWVCLDVSGSMQGSITGTRKGSTSKVRCVDAAALVAAAVLRHNPTAEVLPFSNDVLAARVRKGASLFEVADHLAALGGGGTNISAPLSLLNGCGETGDLVLYVSDNESWVDARPGGRGTALLEEWTRFVRRSPRAKLVCIDLVPNRTTQAPERDDVLNVGGFSDAVFDVVAGFLSRPAGARHWVDEIEKIVL